MTCHAPPDYVCPFCLVVKGTENEHVYTRQADIVYQNDEVTAFVSSHQFLSRGMNVLVIPNEHFENIYALPDAYGRELQKAKRKVAVALKAAYNCDGVSTRQHNEPAGYQDVWHYHVHVTPRFRNDLLYLKMNFGRFKKPAHPEARARHASTLRRLIHRAF